MYIILVRQGGVSHWMNGTDIDDLNLRNALIITALWVKSGQICTGCIGGQHKILDYSVNPYSENVHAHYFTSHDASH